MSAPSKKERQACWEARDKFWKCLDENMEDSSKCDKSRCSFESVCPQQWVKHFNRRREFEKYKATLETGGFQPETPEKS